ncbi:hypothetical protein [Colwellia sp. C1TZA3]|nr:hypothetical protein [Colwellia sp. C1TZA3]
MGLVLFDTKLEQFKISLPLIAGFAFLLHYLLSLTWDLSTEHKKIK